MSHSWICYSNGTSVFTECLKSYALILAKPIREGVKKTFFWGEISPNCGWVA